MEKLFYTNPYLSSWESSIEDVIEKDNKFYVVLSKTAFYPEGGGQPSDFGTIDGIEVIGLSEEKGVIYHILPSAPSKDLVNCEINFSRRFDLMQQHSGQHLLSAVFYNTYDGKTSSFHLGEDYISIDISLSDVSTDLIRDVEEKANQYIYKNLEVKNFIITPDKVADYPLRKLPPTKEDIRIIEIQDVDFSPCCGTHVNRTGEIGIIKIIKHEKYKGITRVYFKCGNRALQDFQNKNDIILNLSKQLSSSENEIIPRVEALSRDLDNALKEVRDYKEKLAYYETQEIIKSSGSNKIAASFTDKSFADIQLLGKQILSQGSFLLVLASETDNRLLFTHDGSFDINCGKIFKESLQNFNGKGGGSDKQAQAGFQSTEAMIKYLAHLKEIIK